MKKPEVMSPIKNWASLEACKNYADAVYFGIADLSLRARTNSLTLKDVPKFVLKCHEYGIKAYMTINSVIYNNDLKIAEKLIKKAKEAKVDAVIVWDLAVIEIAKKEKIPFIISTQANVSNYKTAEFYKKLGAKRVVLARELTLKQIKEIKQKVNIEIETFVHGAMCVAISGRCVLSAYLFNKSSNCGACAQPCRKLWKLSDDKGNEFETEGKYFLNAKDLCMIEFVPELIKAGIDSFKIEGRRRDPKYIEVTAKCYREAVDAYYNKTFTKEKVEAWKEQLVKVYNRGFSTGFYFGEPGKEGISYDQADNISKYEKVLVGHITHYYPKIGVALIDLKHKGLNVNENIQIEGEKTFIEQKVDSMEMKNKEIKKSKKGEEIGIKVKERVYNNDNVFVLKERI
ncbi:MAG TPA: peptidase U32 family protein [Candidatus Pacearchaeota archaeon]|nr:peptidase U32 family protein [Candidatus Pacearchaeota archaeon]